MPPFFKAFIVTVLIQLAILGIIAVAFFGGGPEANPLRALIALVGMVFIGFVGVLGIKSTTGIVAFVLTGVVIVGVLFGWLFSLEVRGPTDGV